MTELRERRWSDAVLVREGVGDREGGRGRIKENNDDVRQGK